MSEFEGVNGMNAVKGTKGYESGVDLFAQASLNLEFEVINRDFLPFLPSVGSHVLDTGCGVGQNAAALAKLGYQVVAVEPLKEFLNIAKATHNEHNINWIEGSLPCLKELQNAHQSFDFILLDGVWHHLNPDERRTCIQRLSDLLSKGGVCAISLRNGPAGMGQHVFPTSDEELLQYVEEFDLQVVLHLQNQPSKIPNKAEVIWSRMALKKRF
ncbi:putative S-adenosyl-L-methionine-dependent methyltransferase [Vibrio nigripulchritudo MADA3029]|uniref:class I SAM-dependent methyltransferase n=1 Tax=Vibrio nigripulchritudo TaxID=28173 RepID=UPI0003B201F0|nr:class I SAM-dependent methyltransferase [Vibrio nigripulchritudo]CCN49078.1 putative S-adenosyl-L-methionine-dependent methyltransferase [Vibrio nigripulchritudo MADA3020]CCN56232.1 putative S-adenosyl-L-methionine-dependent methyltransferase [Vibrio nigripulchritudo MADA3021]CCN57798.1 putative S-adenosyl-L-methionine-dependent methyltransferase [Vibrio nigripulchritudo MADA3029]